MFAFKLCFQEEADGLDRKAKQLVLDSEFASMIEASVTPNVSVSYCRIDFFISVAHSVWCSTTQL